MGDLTLMIRVQVAESYMQKARLTPGFFFFSNLFDDMEHIANNLLNI